MMSSFASDDSTDFVLPPDSPGSSISTRLQDEYDELLRFAVVVPSFDPGTIPKLLADTRGSFPSVSQNQTQESSHFLEDRHEHADDTLEAEAPGKHAAREDETASETTSDQAEEPQESTPISGYSRDAHRASGRPLPRLATMPMGDPLAAKLFMRSDPPNSPRSSVSGFSQITDSEQSYTVSIDQDVTRMENVLDQWSADLKRNVLAEFGQAKIKLIGHHKQQAMKEKERHGTELMRLQNEMDSLRELLHTYEQSVERKDQVITNLTRGLHKQKEKFDMMKTFSDWKIQHNDAKREAVASKLAEKHYLRKLQQKSWDAWHSVVEARWRQRVEKACQAKAQEVCMSLTNDYEVKMASLNEALEGSRAEVNRLHAERDTYEETMKKAFMRGVCALNMEAMTMFSDSESGQQSERVERTQQQVAASQEGEFYSVTIPQEPVFSSGPPGAPVPHVVTSQASRGVVVNSKAITAPQTKLGTKTGKAKVITAKLTGKGEPSRGGQLGLAPPMSSVVVERHQPVNKQTIGHATASRYVRSTDSVGEIASGNKPTIFHRKIAGQALPNQNVQTVKVVE